MGKAQEAKTKTQPSLRRWSIPRVLTHSPFPLNFTLERLCHFFAVVSDSNVLQSKASRPDQFGEEHIEILTKFAAGRFETEATDNVQVGFLRWRSPF